MSLFEHTSQWRRCSLFCKLHHRGNVAAPVSVTLWLSFCTDGGNGNASSQSQFHASSPHTSRVPPVGRSYFYPLSVLIVWEGAEFNMNDNGPSCARGLKDVSNYLISLSDAEVWCWVGSSVSLGCIISQHQHVCRFIYIRRYFCCSPSLSTRPGHRSTVSLSGCLQGSEIPSSSLAARSDSGRRAI